VGDRSSRPIAWQTVARVRRITYGG
jgi:hypothetical protein